MSQINESGIVTRPSAAAIGKYLRVKLNTSGKWAAAGAGEDFDGITTEAVFAADVPLAVKLRNTPGTNWGKLSGSATIGALVYGAASGEIKTSPEGPAIGKAFVAGSSGEVIEVAYYPTPSGVEPVNTVAAAGSAQGDAAALVAGMNTVSAADGTKGVIIDADTPIGATVKVYNLHASNGLKVYPPSGCDINDGTQDAAVTIEGKTVAEFTRLDATTFTGRFTANT